MKIKFIYSIILVFCTLVGSELKVLTYNIHALKPILSGDDPHGRVPKILSKSSGNNIIFFQENWIFSDQYFSKYLPNHQIIKSNVSKFIWPLNNGSGLTLALSDSIAILEINDISYGSCSGWLSKDNDCLATKGFQHIRVNLFGDIIDLYNTHLDAGNSSADINARENQISHIVDYVLENSFNYPVILSGDLNVNQLDINENKKIEELISKLDLSIVDWSSKNPYEKEVLDYILYRGFSLNENKFGVNSTLLGLSDHPPIEANFIIKKTD